MPAVLYEKRGHIALITINRPERHNALNPEAVVQLADAWKTVSEDAEIRVAVVTGAGDQSFCAGADLAELITLFNGARTPENDYDRAVMQDFFMLERTLLRNFDCGKPVICAANGNAIAGGMEMLQGTEIRVIADHAKLGLQEVKWGLFPAGGSTVRLPRQIPYAVAMEILLTGDLISAQRAYELGLVNYVVPADQVMAKAMEIAERIAGNGPLAVREVRRSARECINIPEKEALDKEKMYAAPVMFSKDAREGPRAFKEKRKPNFTGS